MTAHYTLKSFGFISRTHLVKMVIGPPSLYHIQADELRVTTRSRLSIGARDDISHVTASWLAALHRAVYWNFEIENTVSSKMKSEHSSCCEGLKQSRIHGKQYLQRRKERIWTTLWSMRGRHGEGEGRWAVNVEMMGDIGRLIVLRCSPSDLGRVRSQGLRPPRARCCQGNCATILTLHRLNLPPFLLPLSLALPLTFSFPRQSRRGAGMCSPL